MSLSAEAMVEVRDRLQYWLDCGGPSCVSQWPDIADDLRRLLSASRSAPRVGQGANAYTAEGKDARDEHCNSCLILSNELEEARAAQFTTDPENGQPVGWDEVAAALRSRATFAEAQLKKAQAALSEIADGKVPPDIHGHYLAHRAAVVAARKALDA